MKYGEEDESFDTVSYWREPLPEIDLDLLEDLCQEEESEVHDEELQEDIGEDGDDFGYDSDKENAESEEEEDCEDDDDDSWITPSNLKDKKKQFTGDFRGEQELKVT